MPDAETNQRLNAVDERLDRLTGAVDALVTQFLRPLAQQSVENQQSIGRLIEREAQFQEWLDDDRRDLGALRADSDVRFQTLIDEARADRKAANDKFESLQSETRQNQRLMLSGQERLDAILAEVLSLSRRVQAVEDAA
ncbi:MAG: hypothetical protein AAFV90_21950 [Cyanobacteria bacterium J06634_5]